jgi:putative acyl-CoA dehydrogenase
MYQTHDVVNQASPQVDIDLWVLNKPLQACVKAYAPHTTHDEALRLSQLGQMCGSEAMRLHARYANTHAPVLHTHDRYGNRIDRVEFHPSYHALLKEALDNGLHGTPWSSNAGSHVLRAAGFMLFNELEPSVTCPVSMTYAATPALAGNAAWAKHCSAKLTAKKYDQRFIPISDKSALTMGMGMTEKQGGSDVRANTTLASFDGEDNFGRRYTLKGHKWFFSAPMSDAFLVLAQTSQGLSCFFLPRLLPDGTVNAIRILRLKDKLGNRANASGEVEFENATAWLVGDDGRGIHQILQMGTLTRLDCALGSAGSMRSALSMAIHHARQRKAFGKALAMHSQMKNVLADLCIESEAATLLAMRLAASIDRSENGEDSDGYEALMRRVLTPVSKFWICKRTSSFVQEAMECLGGNGFVEDHGQGIVARIYREAPLNSIWEGAGNIMAMDLLRALRSGSVAEALMTETASVRRANSSVDRLANRVHAQINCDAQESSARALCRDVALLVQAACMHSLSQPAMLDAFCQARIEQGSDTWGLLPSTAPFDTLIDNAYPAEV